MRDPVIHCERLLRRLLPGSRRQMARREAFEPRRAIKRSTDVPLQRAYLQ
jgi:hypothetical protein